MKILENGHKYEADVYDINGKKLLPGNGQSIVFVNREAGSEHQRKRLNLNLR